MAIISVRAFMGEIPLVSEQLLADGYSTVARNVKLHRGHLDAWGAPTLITTPTKTGVKQTIYRFGESSATDNQYWFTWTTDVDVVRAPIHNDTAERTYFTGDGPPKKTDTSIALAGATTNYPNNAYLLGVPRPDTSTSMLSVTGTPTNATDLLESTAYLITYVTAWGEEGAPGAAAIGPVDFKPGQTLNLSLLPTAPTGNYNVTSKRIYRSSTGKTGSAYQFVAEIPVANTTYSDSALSRDLGETISTNGWFEPPTNGFGLTLGANGNAIMMAGKTIYPCVPFVLYAYPDAYQLTVDSDIVGAGAYDAGFVILTKAHPYLIMGVDPESYTIARMPENQACVSKRSIVEMQGGVIYASPDGLYAVTPAGMTAITKKMMTKEQWQAFKPESIHAYEQDGRYHAFYDTGTKQGQLIFELGNDGFLTHSTEYCTAAYNDPLRDALYMAQGTTITRWNAGAKQTYVWRSKDYRQTRHTSFTIARVDAETYPITFRFYCDDVLTHTQTVTSDKPFRLPPKPAKIIAFELEGSGIVNGAALATSGEEMIAL